MPASSQASSELSTASFTAVSSALRGLSKPSRWRFLAKNSLTEISRWAAAIDWAVARLRRGCACSTTASGGTSFSSTAAGAEASAAATPFSAWPLLSTSPAAALAPREFLRCGALTSFDFFFARADDFAGARLKTSSPMFLWRTFGNASAVSADSHDCHMLTLRESMPPTAVVDVNLTPAWQCGAVVGQFSQIITAHSLLI